MMPDAAMHRRIGVSIHAPARGATPRIVSSMMHMIRFNPRSRAGSDDAYD